MTEGIDLILKYWTEPGPWQYEGDWFKAEHVGPDPPEGHPHAHHLYPLQQPHPPIALAGITEKSFSLTVCGEARVDTDVARPATRGSSPSTGRAWRRERPRPGSPRTGATGAW